MWPVTTDMVADIETRHQMISILCFCCRRPIRHHEHCAGIDVRQLSRGAFAPSSVVDAELVTVDGAARVARYRPKAMHPGHDLLLIIVDELMAGDVCLEIDRRFTHDTCRFGSLATADLRFAGVSAKYDNKRRQSDLRRPIPLALLINDASVQ